MFIFEAFCLTLVKKNRQNGERRKTRGYLQEKPSRDWLEKTNERASLVHNLHAVHEFFLSADGGVGSFDESSFKSR